MLIDGDALESDVLFQARFCIVGTGMGGSALAHKLANSSTDVLMVEAGPVSSPVRSAASDCELAQNIGRALGTPVTRSIELGGTSNLWHGGWGLLDKVDFEPRPWIEGSGWPICYNDLAPFYAEAAERLDLPDVSLFDPDSIEQRFPRRLSEIAYNRDLLEPKVLWIQKRPLRWKKSILHLAGAGRLRCIVNAPALEMIACESGETIAELIIGTRKGTARIRASAFIVCAGAVETPRLFLNSRRHSPGGLGNSRGLVGCYLLDHPTAHFGKVRFRKPLRARLYSDMPSSPDMRARAGLRLRSEQQHRYGLPNYYLWIRPSLSPSRVDDAVRLSFLGVRTARDLSMRQVRAILTNPDLLYRGLVYRFGLSPIYIYGDLLSVAEQLPNARSCVRLSDHRRDRYGYAMAEVNWQLCDADFSCFHQYTSLLSRNGLRTDQYDLVRIEPIERWAESVSSSAHHLGTARMGRVASHGVVNENLRVFGVHNLFVCDGSVFPTTGGVNPSFTIVALARRLGEHLLKTVADYSNA